MTVWCLNRITISSVTPMPGLGWITSEYGRTCKDIGCMRDEVCVMAEDPCSIYQRDNCGRYPTCMKSRPGEANCASTLCGENEYCKTENGVPTCVKKSAVNGFESAGVSYVNGQRVNTDEKHLDKTTASNSASNSNPYANANAPPAPAEPAGGYRHQVNSATNLGYPPYPSSDTGSKSGYPSYPGGNTGSNNGYPPYPSPNQGNRQQDLGYPPYPTHNKMPMPGQSNYPSYPGQPGHSNYPVYPGQQPGYPGYPQQLPGHQNYPYPNYPNQNRMYHNNVYSGYRRNSAIVHSPCSVIVYLAANPTRRPGKIRPTSPTPPPRSSSNGYGGRMSGNSGSRNTIGNGSIFNRLFGNDRIYGSNGVTTPKSSVYPGGSGYYKTHTSVDDQGNRVWKFFG
ncbi:hypothetical protein APICC_03350 [Apis cerana cerana]|uniref:Uncharacterized protein n=1 Tax=Apis cerana cerana TaxID=94128 RepID=A0A2A3EC83_APICC|nr:hypothetical protein APICC_03350 [Apis cerana cerana]